jgi:hypothetical protein
MGRSLSPRHDLAYVSVGSKRHGLGIGGYVVTIYA